MAQTDSWSRRRHGAHWDGLCERQSEHSEVQARVSSPSPEIDPWDRAELGVIDVAAVLDFIAELRRVVDAEEQRLLERWGSADATMVMSLEEYREVYPDGP